MGQTAFATDNALVKKAWDEKLYRDIVKESYFSKFEGNSAESLVHVKTELEKDQGDNVTFGLRMRLTGAGKTDDEVLEGNEEALSTYNDSVSLHLYRHAVRDNGAMSRKRAMFSISNESKDAIKDWGSEKIDALKFTAILASPTRIAYKTNSATLNIGTVEATVKTALTAADSKLTPEFITALKIYAQTGGDRRFIPIRPIKYKGKKYFVLLTHPDSLYDMKTNSTVKSAWENAVERGYDNPLFNDAEIMWDGVVIHTHENCTLGADAGAGANVHWVRSVFMGCQALCWAWGKRPWTVMRDFDYENQEGHAWNAIAAVKKPKFNSEDFGSIGVFNARTNISGQ